jgi:hypothetical protein
VEYGGLDGGRPQQKGHCVPRPVRPGEVGHRVTLPGRVFPAEWCVCRCCQDLATLWAYDGRPQRCQLQQHHKVGLPVPPHGDVISSKKQIKQWVESRAKSQNIIHQNGQKLFQFRGIFCTDSTGHYVQRQMQHRVSIFRKIYRIYRNIMFFELTLNFSKNSKNAIL